MTVRSNLKSLYDIDNEQWLEATIDLLKEGQNTGYEIVFPQDCPHTLEQLLERNWLPERG